jgi:hypothetical protein
MPVPFETKLHIHVNVVRTSTWARLERDLPRRDLSVYQHYRHLVLSIDFAKRDSRRSAFLAVLSSRSMPKRTSITSETGGRACASFAMGQTTTSPTGRNPTSASVVSSVIWGTV